MKIAIADIEGLVKLANEEFLDGGYCIRLRLIPHPKGKLIRFYMDSQYDGRDQFDKHNEMTTDLTPEKAMQWFEGFFLPIFELGRIKKPESYFPSGFESWQETHFEMVSVIQLQCMVRGSLSCQRHEELGMGGLYELAKEMTNDFEKENMGREWDGEFFDQLDKFCRIRNL